MMLKEMENLGTVLSKSEQVEIIGGLAADVDCHFIQEVCQEVWGCGCEYQSCMARYYC